VEKLTNKGHTVKGRCLTEEETEKVKGIGVRRKKKGRKVKGKANREKREKDKRAHEERHVS